MLFPIQDASADIFAARKDPRRMRQSARIVSGINSNTGPIFIAQHDTVEFPTSERR